MNTLRHNTKGFGTIELLLALVVVAVLAGAGAYLYYQDHKASTTSEGTSHTQTNQNITSAGPVFNKLLDGWVEYKNNDAGLRLGYPKEWGTLDSTTLETATYQNDSQNLQGKFSIAIAKKAGFTVVARKYGATIAPSSDGTTWTVVAENPADVDGYKVGDTYKATTEKVNGGIAIDLSFVDEECTQTRWLLSLKDSYAVVTIPELCPATLQPIPDTNKTAYATLKTDFLSSITVY